MYSRYSKLVVPGLMRHVDSLHNADKENIAKYSTKISILIHELIKRELEIVSQYIDMDDRKNGKEEGSE